MIALFTDFGTNDPYVGQVKARIHEHAPHQLVVDLLHEAPVYNPQAGAHLIAAFAHTFPPGTVFLCVIDPDVGTDRGGAVVSAGGRWFVGPDNGLLSVMAARQADAKVWRIVWRSQAMSNTFHGRDVFAVIGAQIAIGEFPTTKLEQVDKLNVEFDAGDLARVIYVDHFGNAWTGIRAGVIAIASRVVCGKGDFRHAPAFGFVGHGEGFWFCNSVGLLEMAINRGHAAKKLGLDVGDPVRVLSKD